MINAPALGILANFYQSKIIIMHQYNNGIQTFKLFYIHFAILSQHNFYFQLPV